MSKTALITGITGQDGSLLGEYLTSLGYTIYGIVRGQNNPKLPWLKKLLPNAIILEGDLLDTVSIIRAVITSNPDEIYNFGAVSNIPICWNQTDLVFKVNTLGVLNVLEAVRLHNQDIKVFQASSTEIFGHETPDPINEDTPTNPKSPYAIAKLAAQNICRAYRHNYGIKISCAISANHESCRRGLEFVTRKVCRSAAEIKLGLKDSFVLGNVSAYRDWGWAPDYVKYYHKMLQTDPDDLIIATGVCHTVEDLVNCAFSYVGLNWKTYVAYSKDSVNIATGTVPIILDTTKAATNIGFSVETKFEDWVSMIVENELRSLNS